MATNATSTDAGVPTTPTPSPSPSPSPTISTTPPPNTPSPSTSIIIKTTSSPAPPLTTPSDTPSPTPTPTPTTPAIVVSTPISTTTEPGGSTITVFKTSTQGGDTPANTGTATSSSPSGASTASLQSGAKVTSSGLGSSGTIAVAVVVPIVVVALLVIAGILLWRRRKARKDEEELRRKEVEEYGYNPNNDPTLPAVGVVGGSADGPYEMREDGSSGYRGWGTTALASSGRKASTTISGGQSAAGGGGVPYSEGTSPTRGPVSDTRSDNPLMDGRPLSTELEALGAMGPAASANRTGDINRGPSNASSSYSAANRSDGSGEIPPAGAYYNNQYDTGNPYSPDTQYGSPPGRAEVSGQPVIRDVQARRNTRIENPSHFPQQSAGISQNF